MMSIARFQMAAAVLMMPSIMLGGMNASAASAPVPASLILIWDTPVDLDHPYVHEQINLDAMASIRVPVNDDSLSLLEINETEIKPVATELLGASDCLHPASRCSTERFESYADDFEALSERTRPMSLLNWLELLKSFAEAPFRDSKRLSRLQAFAHGTAMTGIAARDLPKNSVVTVPTNQVALSIEIERADPVTITKAYRAHIHQKFAILNSAIEQTRVRIVNWSGNFSLTSVESMLAAFQERSRQAYPPELARELLQISIDETTALYERFPQVLFVVAAGNDYSQNTKASATTNSIRAPNVVYVTNTSFYANSVSDIQPHHLKSRPGIAETSIPAGLFSYFEGTSVSAPDVSNEAGHLLVEDADQTVEELIEAIAD